MIGMLPVRHVFMILACILLCMMYGHRTNLSLAIVAMVNHTQSGGSPRSLQERTCEFQGEEESPLDGPFHWSEPTQGLILGSYFWGYMASQLPGGRLAEVFSAKWMIFVAAILNIVPCLLIPTLSYLHYSALVVLRVVQGIGGGVSLPAMHVMIVRWAPLQERNIMSALIYAGMALGTVISLLMTGGISAALSWEATFYIQGGLSLVWCVLWVWLMSDSPDSSRFITAEERDYIEAYKDEDATKTHSVSIHAACELITFFAVPWLQVFTSPPFLAILLVHFCTNFGWYMLFIELPRFMSSILRFNITSNTLLSALPFLLMWMYAVVLTNFLQFARNREFISTATSRKIATSTASLVPCACFIGVGFVGCNRTAAVTLMALSATAMGGSFSGYLSNHMDIAPNYAGTLIAITNTVATIPGFVVPALIGYLTHQNQTIYAWRIVFLITSGMLLLGAVVYVVFGSDEVQPWNQLRRRYKSKKVHVKEQEQPLNRPLQPDESGQVSVVAGGKNEPSDRQETAV